MPLPPPTAQSTPWPARSAAATTVSDSAAGRAAERSGGPARSMPGVLRLPREKYFIAIPMETGFPWKK